MKCGSITRLALAAAFALLPNVARAQTPYSTAQLNNGTNDLAWNVSVDGGSFYSAFILADRGAQWIGASASGSLPGGQADGNLTRFGYTYQTTFTGGSIGSATVQCAVDDVFRSIMLNGSPISGTCDQYGYGASVIVLPLDAGTNVLTVNLAGNGITDGFKLNVISTTEAVTATPEPATIALLATGLSGVFGAARRRRKLI